VLLFVALVLAWRNPRWVPVPVALALLILLLASNSWIANNLVKSLEWQNIPSKELPKAEAIVILGGGTRPAFPPRPTVDLKEQGDRILYGAQLYREGKAPLVVASGGRIAWRGGGPSESVDMAEILKTLGVPASAILQDPTSLNTHQNAVNVKQILAERSISKVLLVTSAMHMPRSLAIFRHEGIEATAAPTDFLVTKQEIEEVDSSTQAIVLSALPDADRLEKTTSALKEYLGSIVYRLRGWL